MKNKEMITKVVVLLVVVVATVAMFNAISMKGPSELLPNQNTITGNAISSFYNPDSPTSEELRNGITINDSWYFFYWPEDAETVPIEEAMGSVISENVSSHIWGTAPNGASNFWFNPQGRFASYSGSTWDTLTVLVPGGRYGISFTEPHTLRYPMLPVIILPNDEEIIVSNPTIIHPNSTYNVLIPAPGQVCGNGIIEGTEVCDGVESVGLGGENSCVDLGYSGGTLTCANDCLSFNTSRCFISTCFDSDGGTIEGVQGIINFSSGDYDQTYTDYCLNDSTLLERYCTESNNHAITDINCPNGCSNGACITSTGGTGGGGGGNLTLYDNITAGGESIQLVAIGYNNATFLWSSGYRTLIAPETYSFNNLNVTVQSVYPWDNRAYVSFRF